MENILTAQKDQNLVIAIVKAIINNHSDDEIIESVIDVIKNKQASKGTIAVVPEALRSYAKNISESLIKIANIISEKYENPIEKTAELTDNIKVSEIWENFEHDKQLNKISGILTIDFNQDISDLIKDTSLVLASNNVLVIKQKAFEHIKNEYKNLKADLSDKIFKTNLVFKDVKTGKAEVKYEIENAY